MLLDPAEEMLSIEWSGADEKLNNGQQPTASSQQNNNNQNNQNNKNNNENGNIDHRHYVLALASSHLLRV